MSIPLNKTVAQLLDRAKRSTINPRELLEVAQRLQNNDVPSAVIHEFLKLGHYPTVNSSFYRSELGREWFSVLVELIKSSGYHVGYLMRQRARQYADKPLFQLIRGKQVKSCSYQESWKRIKQIGCSILCFTEKTKTPVIGIYTPNSLEGALVDLACLSFNFRVVPIPANVSENHLIYILHHAGITHLFLGGTTPCSIFQQIPKQSLQLSVIQLSDTDNIDYPTVSWNSFIAQGTGISDKVLLERLSSVGMDELASVMYTSGTTADPKGIIFTQTNIISKRFARGLALPEFSSAEVFLSYLPLYHTFGRFLELLGSIFWGATYTFAESPAFKTLLKDFLLVKPTVFISIPKRWIQLTEFLGSQIDIEEAPTEKITDKLMQITGGRLKWGLSAAGYLDPDIFIFFRKHGINLLSGYGMTEATGGITMTPPDDYQRDSVGKPLPGVDVKLAEDGELLLRGPYISPGYFQDTEPANRTDGWFHTGDIFREKRGHYYIVDRKKEIYKNSRGQTISPQRIENMFQDFEAIKSVFLVGDGREYNTLLIYPDFKNTPVEFKKGNEQAIRDYFSSLVQSVNSFLAPYERIVNFALIQRDFSTEYGELTPKKTYKRKVILKNFASIIEPMYAKDYISLVYNDYEIQLPNWFLREKGIIRSDITWDGREIRIRNHPDKLPLHWNGETVLVGDYRYSCPQGALDIQALLMSPELWLGNQTLVEFIGDPIFRIIEFEPPTKITLEERQLIFNPDSSGRELNNILKNSIRDQKPTLSSLHTAAKLLQCGERYELLTAINHLHQAINQHPNDIARVGLALLRRMQYHPTLRMRLKTLELMLPLLPGDQFITHLLEIYSFAVQTRSVEMLALEEQALRESHFRALLSYLGYLRQEPDLITSEQIGLIEWLLDLVSDYGKVHPSSYVWSRAELIWWQMSPVPEPLLSASEKAYHNLVDGFRKWLGPVSKLAIDRETGEEYDWADVIEFDEGIDRELQDRLLTALSNTPLIREAVFIFSKRRLIQLDDIQRRGIWISLLGRNHGKSVFRVLVQTREMDAFNFVINVNEELDKEFIQDEIRWLVMTGSSIHGPKLVEDFGGYWPEYDLYTEEYVPGETLYQYLERNREEIASKKALDRWQMRWLHFIWNGLMAYFDFWRRSSYTLRIDNPTAKNLIIPEHDYTSGTRLISISNRISVGRVSDLVFDLFERFILATEKEYPGLKRMADWEVLFTAMFQTISVKRGIRVLRTLLEELQDEALLNKAESLGLTPKRIADFIDDVNVNGILTKQVVFAALRYERWLELNPEATYKARGNILQELYKDYGLNGLLEDYPETRIRFFLMTCFKNANRILTDRLLQLQKDLRARTISIEELEHKLHEIHESLELTEEEEYFFTRLLFEHLDAAEYGELIAWDLGTGGRLDLITLTEDKFGDRYRIRPPFHPKEIAKFHSILLQANLSATFQQAHEFLLIINEKDQLVGGVYWKKISPQVAYVEKIVIRRQYQKRHLSVRLLEELFNRLRTRRFKYVTVGFFHAGLFYKYGFQIDKQFGGLVKVL
ncbi:MAG: GNAT family N-acetyltransferase [FCB group bacterium]|nr:GNAT family N-acetyltransferase [FCB group bacterium]